MKSKDLQTQTSYMSEFNHLSFTSTHRLISFPKEFNTLIICNRDMAHGTHLFLFFCLLYFYGF